MKFYFHRMKGVDKSPPRKPMSKIGWSWLEAFIGIYAIAQLESVLPYGNGDSMFPIGSFGASAVLVYGAPMAEFSQPGNLILGHVSSAIIGITVYKLLPHHIELTSALAVSLTIFVMHLIRSLHPPGGATALIAVIGSSNIHELGYWFVLTPVLTGAVILLVIGVVVNNLSGNPKRHYPATGYNSKN